MAARTGLRLFASPSRITERAGVFLALNYCELAVVGGRWPVAGNHQPRTPCRSLVNQVTTDHRPPATDYRLPRQLHSRANASAYWKFPLFNSFSFHHGGR